MYCPRCSQQCVSDVRFCSRCGLPLNLIAQITANDGMALGAYGNHAHPATSSRQKGTRAGTILILASVVLAPIFFGLSVLVDGPAPLLLPLTVFLTGLSVVLYARTFGESVPVSVNHQLYQADRPAVLQMLPSAERPSIDGLAPRRVNTSDMAEPPPVTDHTTQLFD
jgi:hypothetical protein